MGRFYEELNEVANPEELLLGLCRPYENDGYTMRCMYHPTKATTMIVDPQDLSYPQKGCNQVEFAINKAITYFSKVDTRIAKIIESDERCVVEGTSTYMLHIISGLHKSREASAPLDRLIGALKICHIQDGNLDCKELLKMLEEFAKAGNPFKVLYEELHKANPSPNAVLKKLEILNKKYDKEITSEKRKRTLTSVGFSIVTVAFAILLAFKGPFVAFAAPPLLAARASIDMIEASRKDKADDIKEKRKWIAKTKETLSLYNLLQEDLSRFVKNYDGIIGLIEELRTKMDNEYKDMVEGESSLRRMAMNVETKVGLMTVEAQKVKTEMEKVESLMIEVDCEASSMHIEQDLGKIKDDYYYKSKKDGFFKRLLGKKKK